MATITMTARYSDLGPWPGALLAADDVGSIDASSATQFGFTLGSSSDFAGYKVLATGRGFAYDVNLPISGDLDTLTFKDAAGHLVLRVSDIAADGVADSLALVVAFAAGWSDSTGYDQSSEPKNAWSALLSGNDVINGTAGDDNWGMPALNPGNDVFNMRGGDDWVNASTGDDTINGGAGWDTVYYGQTAFQEGLPMLRGITVNMGAGTVLDPFGDTDHFTGIEEFQGSVANDRFIGGAAGADFLGLRGADRIVAGSSGADWAIYGDDAEEGGMRGIVARLQTSGTGAHVHGTVRDGFGSTDQLTNILNVAGTLYADRFTGSDGNNLFAGGEGRDSYDGGAGKDGVIFDWWFGDTDLAAITINLKLASGQVVNDGFGNSETLVSIEDIITGSGNDRITGSTGANRIEARGGADTMTGGGGADTFVFSGSLDYGQGDVITDFHAAAGANHDVIGIEVSHDGISGSVLLVNGTAATARAATLIFDSATHNLWFDADGTGAGAAVQVVRLTGVTVLTMDDFDLY